MPPTCLFVSNAPVLRVEFTLSSASHPCEEPLKQDIEVTTLERKDKRKKPSLSFSEGCGSKSQTVKAGGLKEPMLLSKY